MSAKPDDLYAKISALQFTLMTPNPVTVTLGESQLTDDILQAFADEIARLRGEIEEKVIGENWTMFNTEAGSNIPEARAVNIVKDGQRSALSALLQAEEDTLRGSNQVEKERSGDE